MVQAIAEKGIKQKTVKNAAMNLNFMSFQIWLKDEMFFGLLQIEIEF